MQRVLVAVLLVYASMASGCYWMRPSTGGGKTSFESPRKTVPGDVALPSGYRAEVVAEGLTFPTGVTFDDAGNPYVVEAGYSYGEVWTRPRLLKVLKGQAPVEVASGTKNGPWTGVAFHGGNFYVAEGGQLEGGRILRISTRGEIRVLVKDLPSRGDHHTDGPVFGRDGKLYFGQGTATNSGVVGRDNYDFGWLKRFKDFHDTPCRDVTLTGENYSTADPFKPGETVVTGPFLPFGTPSSKNQVVKGSVPCNGAVMRVAPDGGDVELVAWGFRNPFGLAFAPDGKLYVTDNSYDERGSRPVFGTGDLLWEVKEGGWYGWPDFHGKARLDDADRYSMPRKGNLSLVLAQHPGKVPEPAAILAVHSSSNGFDFSRNPAFGHVGEAFIAQFGDQAEATGKVLAPVGFKVVRVDPRTGVITDFMVNRAKGNGPASRLGSGGIERPVAARFDPKGESLYVVDFGVMMMDGKQPKPQEKTGVLWRIYREGK